MFQCIKSLLFLTFVGFVVANHNVYDNNYSVNSYNVEKPTCNKTKITNVVPVYDLCYWTKIEWRNYKRRTDISNCNLHGSEGNYIPSRCIPSQIRLYNGRCYVIINREIGVYSNINYFELSDITADKKCPKLECFRECSRTQLARGYGLGRCSDDNNNYIINARDIFFTDDQYAWLLDIGVYFRGTTPIYERAPRICAYDVAENVAAQTLCFVMPPNLYNQRNQVAFNSILVDDSRNYRNHIIFIFNSISGSIIVFNQDHGRWWSIRSALFRPEPSESLFSFTLPNYQNYQFINQNGIYTGVRDRYGLIVSAQASNDPYFISYQTLNNDDNTACTELTYNIRDLGDYNCNGQTYGIERNNDVLFFIQPQNHALVCANKKQRIDADSLQYLFVDRCRFPHLVSIDLYKNDLYVLSNNLIDIQVNGFCHKKRNFVISYLHTNEIDALYPNCSSYFDDSNNCRYSQHEETLAQTLVEKNRGNYDIYNDHYQHKKCYDNYPPDHYDTSHKCKSCYEEATDTTYEEAKPYKRTDTPYEEVNPYKRTETTYEQAKPYRPTNTAYEAGKPCKQTHRPYEETKPCKHQGYSSVDSILKNAHHKHYNGRSTYKYYRST